MRVDVKEDRSMAGGCAALEVLPKVMLALWGIHVQARPFQAGTVWEDERTGWQAGLVGRLDWLAGCDSVVGKLLFGELR